MDELIDATKAVIARWDTPLWKDVPATGEYINRLRAAAEWAENPPADFQTWYKQSGFGDADWPAYAAWIAAQQAERERCREIVITMGGPDVPELLRQIDSGEN